MDVAGCPRGLSEFWLSVTEICELRVRASCEKHCSMEFNSFEMPLANVLLLSHFFLLLCIYRVVCAIHTLLLKGSAVSSPRLIEAAAAQTSKMSKLVADTNSADKKPTIASLGNDVPPKKGHVAAVEWAPFTAAELDVMKEVQKWLNWDGDGAFESVPFDLLTCFVRGFSYRPDWPRSCAAYLEQSMAWRRQHVYGDPPLIFGKGAQLPAQREYYETVFQCGPIGFDADGHPVLLERCCMTSPLEWLPRLDIETLIQNMAFNREATRACLNAQSHRLGKRVYKSCIIVDLAGLSLAHTDKRSVSAFSKINSLFSNTYPEWCARH